MISIIIRNRNEAENLKQTLHILSSMYSGEFSEIIVIDNMSTDNSREIAKSFSVKVVSLKEFSYGRAINIGIAEASSPYVLLLSSHAVPVGKSFFLNTLSILKGIKGVAGVRFIDSIKSYQRAIENDFVIKDGLSHGLMAACAVVKKSVWEQIKFDEELCFSEDKAWSEAVMKKGFSLIELPETFFYFASRDGKAEIQRWKNETLAHYQLHDKNFPGRLRITASFFKKLLITNPKLIGKIFCSDLKTFQNKLAIWKTLNRER